VFGGYLVVHLLINATIAAAGRVPGSGGQDPLAAVPAAHRVDVHLPADPLPHGLRRLDHRDGPAERAALPYEKNIFYVLQRISAVIIVFFMLFHVLSLKYGWLG
jgi:hypothetical protein